MTLEEAVQKIKSCRYGITKLKSGWFKVEGYAPMSPEQLIEWSKFLRG